MEYLLSNKTNRLKSILHNIDGLITEPFIFALRDTSLPMRGSSNQKIMNFDKKNNFWYNIHDENERYYL